jgi:two-component system, OmpR family, KDP operon response regulator KdpE
MPAGTTVGATPSMTNRNNEPTLLLVEDDASMRKFLRAFLVGAGYQVEEAASAQEALLIAPKCLPGLVILDLGLPDVDGQELLTLLREWLKAPIIVLTVRDSDAQKVMALDHGADDYLTKPFSTGELLARIRVALRHAERIRDEQIVSTFQVGDLRIDFATRQVFIGDREAHLTPIEFKLLATLSRDAGKVLTHRHLLNEVWGPHHLDETPYLRVFMASLRRKIEADSAQPRYLLTEQGVGYRLAAD